MINRCLPGHGASCALCCGSHNYALDRELIEEIFLERGLNVPDNPAAHPEAFHADKLFPDAMQCVHVGTDASGRSGVCCLVYASRDRGEALESFFNGTCKHFYCGAWDYLTDAQVEFAARLMGDWYYYSLLLNDIEAVHELCSAYAQPEDVPPEKLEELKEALVEKFLEEDGK